MPRKSGFSLVEVVIAAIIFTLSVGSIYAALGSLGKVSDRQTIINNKVLYGQKFLESLYSNNTATQWSSGRLAIGAGNPDYPGYNIPADPDYPGYAGTYAITTDTSGARKVTLSITSP